MKQVDVVIIGAGPAGTVCGYLLKQAGISTLLVDHATFPRDKVCGGGLSARSWKMLDELIPGFKYEYNRVRKIQLTVNEKHRSDFELDIELRLVKRREFDNQLLEVYKSVGGQFQQGGFSRYDETPDGLVVTLKSGQQIECKYLVGADGSASSVRHFLANNHDNGYMILEQYVQKSPANTIELGLSRQYDNMGYYYRFPNSEFDAVGYGDVSVTTDKFRQVLKQKNIPETKIRGCHMYLGNDYPLHDRVILIGDAGGFANRVTFEGIKAAFETARNAAEAIKTGRPFREVNAYLFEKLAKEERFAQFIYKPSSLKFVAILCHIPGAIKWFFDSCLRPR
jgi:flavin-dependent dehydrogenase